MALRSHVQCLWRLRDAAPSPAPQTIYPDGRCEIIVHLAVPMHILGADGIWRAQSRCLFAAQARAAIRLRAVGALDCLGARLHPAASSALIDPQASGSRTLASLVDRVVDLDLLDARLAQALGCHLDGGPVDPQPGFVQLLTERLAQRAVDAGIAAVVRAIDAACGNLAVRSLAASSGIGLRTLQVRFLRAVGLTLKEYALVQRLQATIRQLDGGEGALAETALDAGFADQAHATRAVRKFAGLTPAKLRRALQAERDGDRTLALAAAFVRGGSD
jgi:AraC-like DNA-binding protein